MNLTTATLFLASTLAAISPSTTSANHKVDYGNDGFYATGLIDFDSTLEGNTEIIGAHLHTGSSTTNGPVNVIFCGSAPLPDVLTIDGPCKVGEVRDIGEGEPSVGKDRYVKTWEANPDNWLLEEVFTNGANDATSVQGATTLADGAPTIFDSFREELLACTVDECNVYFNIHTNYSFNLNAGAYGLARAQLSPVTCDEKELKLGFYMGTAKCFTAIATSNNTNMVTGIPNQLAPNAGYTIGDLLVVYQGGGSDVEDGDDYIGSTHDYRVSSSASLSLLLSLIIATITMSTMML